MGKSRDGKVSKNFGDKDNKIKARFANEAQARRVAVLFEYVRVAIGDGATVDNIKELLRGDIDKCIEVLEKIKKDKTVMAGAPADEPKPGVSLS